MKLSPELEEIRTQLILDHWNWMEDELRSMGLSEDEIIIRRGWYLRDAAHFFGHGVEEGKRKHKMSLRNLFVSTLMSSAIYAFIVAWAWAWALHAEFDWWKLPIIGGVNFLLAAIANFIIIKGE